MVFTIGTFLGTIFIFCIMLCYHVLKVYLRVVNTTVDYKTSKNMPHCMFQSAEIVIRWSVNNR
jgi:hypothetical protein